MKYIIESYQIIPVKAALAVGKNHNVLLMMMGAFPPSAATASDATTTSGFGSSLGSGSQSKHSRSYLKLILCCFLPNSCPHTKFHPNWTKNIEVKKISVKRDKCSNIRTSSGESLQKRRILPRQHFGPASDQSDAVPLGNPRMDRLLRRRLLDGRRRLPQRYKTRPYTV